MWRIVRAKTEDVKAIMNLFRQCTVSLISIGIHQWDGTYPTKAIFLNDIVEGNVFVVRENRKILATITLNRHQDEQYKSIVWRFESERVLVIHRLAVSPLAQGKGLGKQLCAFSESFGIENGYETIRLDAYSGNPISCSVYEKLNYHRAEGYCWFHGNELPFYCYEKRLSAK